MAKEGFALAIRNSGRAGAAFALYPAGPGEPRFYTVGAGGSLEDLIPVAGDAYDLALHGPNGFLRVFKGQTGPAKPVAEARFDAKSGRLLLSLRNDGPQPVTLDVKPAAYIDAPARLHRLAPRAEVVDAWDLRPSHNWYDFVVTCAEAPSFRRRFAGHGEDGKPSLSDPLLGRQT